MAVETTDDFTSRIKTVDRLAISVQHPCARIDLDPTESEDIGRNDREGMKGRLIDWQRPIRFRWLTSRRRDVVQFERTIITRRARGIEVSDGLFQSVF